MANSLIEVEICMPTWAARTFLIPGVLVDYSFAFHLTYANFDNGVWLANTKEFHYEILREKVENVPKIKSLTSITLPVYRYKLKGLCTDSHGIVELQRILLGTKNLGDPNTRQVMCIVRRLMAGEFAVDSAGLFEVVNVEIISCEGEQSAFSLEFSVKDYRLLDTRFDLSIKKSSTTIASGSVGDAQV
jgi:hypothetical protein